ncbi:MAG: hypothetical protein HRU43_01110, partial [Simkaniaceae bacterium]|nr:hypothetical protein [Simkaniaceae bacterium]
DCKVSGWIEDKHLVSVDVEGLNARDVVAKFVDKELIWKGDSVFGKGEFDFSTPDFFDGTYWEARIDGGQCFYREHHLQDISLSLSMHDQYLKPSVLKCQYEGLEGVFAFEGLYSHLNINVDILLYPEKLAELLHIPKPKNMSQAVALDLDMKLKTVDSRLGVEGSLGFLREGEKDDTIEFGWNWDLKRFSKGEFLKGIELGWFRGEKVSARTINLPLLIWNRDFRGRGFIGLDGTFNSKAVEFTVDPSDLKYESDAIDIIPNPQEIEKAPNCNFFFDFEKKTWRGKIPLKNAYVTEHSFGLHFSSFTSEVDLEGNEFLFQNVDAISNGVRFQAEIAVDFALDDRNELKINTYSIDGDVKDVLSILRHFEPFKETQLPLSGKMKSGPGDMHLRAYVGGVEELLEWRIGLHLQDGAFPFSETFGFENLSGELFFSAEDERFKIEKVAGDLTLTAGNKPKSYALNVPLLEMDAKEGVLIYDCRLEAPTYEICRVFGRGINEQDEFLLHLDPDKTRFFGARMKVDTLAFKGGALERAAISTKLSALDVVHHIDFLNSAGLLPIKDETLDEMRGPHIDGEVSLSFLLDRSDETFSFDVKSSRLKIGAIDLDHLNLSGKRKGDSFSLDQFESGALKIQAEMIKDLDRWRLPHLSVLWKQSFLKSGAVTFDEERGKLKVPLEGLRLDLEEMKALLPQLNVDWDYIKGVLFAKGNVIFDFSKGWNHWTVDSELSCVGEDIGRGRLRVESPKSVRISYEMGKGVIMHQADFNFLHPRSNQLWAKVHLDRLSLKQGTIKGEGSKLIVPPEMVHFIGQTHSLPHISYEEERMIVFGYPIRWDNQIEASFDFELGDSPKMNGYLKEG